MNKLSQLLGMPFRVLIYTFMLLLFLIFLSVSILSVDYFVEYSSFPIGLTKAIIGIIVLSVVDDVIFWKINTIEAIKDKNISYAIIYLSNAIIIASCIGFA